MADSVIRSAPILVVDDDETVRSTLKEYLDANGFQVITAGNGKEAIDLMAENHEQIGLVVSDIRMPVLDGISLIRRIREIWSCYPYSGYLWLYRVGNTKYIGRVWYICFQKTSGF